MIDVRKDNLLTNLLHSIFRSVLYSGEHYIHISILLQKIDIVDDEQNCRICDEDVTIIKYLYPIPEAFLKN